MPVLSLLNSQVQGASTHPPHPQHLWLVSHHPPPPSSSACSIMIMSHSIDLAGLAHRKNTLSLRCFLTWNSNQNGKTPLPTPPTFETKTVSQTLTCEQALLFGQAMWASRERASEGPFPCPSRLRRSLARSRETPFTRPNRRASSQASQTPTVRSGPGLSADA